MASSIDSTKPETGNATTLSVRDNFAAAKSEIEALQANTVTAGTGLSGGGAISANPTLSLDGTSSLNLDHSTISVLAGAGLTGGGTIAADRTLNIGAGTGITVNADDVALDTASSRNADHSSISITAGSGLTGGGTIASSRTLNIGEGTGITVNANDVAFDTTWGDARYLTGNQTITLTGDVSGSGTTSIAVTVADDSHNHVTSNIDGLDVQLSNITQALLLKLDATATAADSSKLGGVLAANYARTDTREFFNAQVSGNTSDPWLQVTLESADTELYGIRIADFDGAPNFRLLAGNGTSSSPTQALVGEQGTISFGGIDNTGSDIGFGALRCTLNQSLTTTNRESDFTFLPGTNSGGLATRLIISGSGPVTPGSDNVQTLGSASLRWSTVYAGTGTINTSDRRMKQDITALPVSAAYELITSITPVRYKWKDTVNQVVVLDGEGEPTGEVRDEVVPADTRHYLGYIAQDAGAAMQGIGQNPADYAMFEHSEASDRWGMRYTELLAPLHTVVKDLVARIEALESP